MVPGTSVIKISDQWCKTFEKELFKYFWKGKTVEKVSRIFVKRKRILGGWNMLDVKGRVCSLKAKWWCMWKKESFEPWTKVIFEEWINKVKKEEVVVDNPLALFDVDTRLSANKKKGFVADTFRSWCQVGGGNRGTLQKAKQATEPQDILD